MTRTALILIVALLGVVSSALAGPQRDAAAPRTEWSIWGGEAAFRWNDDLLRVFGVELSGIDAGKLDEYGYRRVAVRDAAALRFAVRQGSFDGFTGGGLALGGGFELRSQRGVVSLRRLRFAPRAGAPFVLDVIGDDGVAWFYADRLMYDIVRGTPPMLDLRTMDLRIGAAFAAHLGDPAMEGNTIADVALRSRIHAADGDYSALAAKGTVDKWPGDMAPDGSRYQADVFMHSFTAVWKRQSTAVLGLPAVDGPGGNNGAIVYAPSSTLRNNRNDGTPVQTIADPLGTSTALWTANVAWYEKFTGSFAPYRNDQHPYLIWNLYRTDALGRLVQIARSGVKHAFLTVNVDCDEHPGSNHVLGRGCSDTYGDSNNDSIGDLGPRSEIIPATAQWGRCGSVYDRDCDGARDSGSPCSNVGGAACSNWAFRLAAREDDIQATTNAGATYRMESWYVVRDDIDIFNTMQTRGVGFTWNSVNRMWQVANSGALQLGPAIDRWVPRDTQSATQSSASIATGDGQARVAVKVAALGGGKYRYTYAVMNFDFAKAVTEGGEEDLRVLSNDGFAALRVPRAAGVIASAAEWFDGDGAAWALATAGDAYTWTAPAGNALNWGSLYTFSFVANAEPVAGTVTLTTAQTGTPETIDVAALVPGAGTSFTVGGTVTGVTGTDGVDLQLDAGAPLTRSVDGAFEFPVPLADGTAYTVRIVREPTGHVCSIAHAQGIVAADNVTDVEVDCAALPPPRVPMGGSVQGLAAGRSVSLSLDGAASFAVSANGAFTFPTQASVGDAYAVQVTAQPAGQSCSLLRGSGTVPAGGVGDIGVECADLPIPDYPVGGTVSGLGAGQGVTLSLNGTQTLSRNADGPFQFGQPLQDGAAYTVSIVGSVGTECQLSGGSGTVQGAAVSTVAVACLVPWPGFSNGFE